MLVNGTCGNTRGVKFGPGGGRGEYTETSTHDSSSVLSSLVQVTWKLLVGVVTHLFYICHLPL
jgi:hypothetical protein